MTWLPPAVVLEGVLRSDLELRALSVVVTVALVPLLLWRRSHPLKTVAIAFTIAAVVPLITGGRAIEPNTMAYLILLPYALFRWGSGRQMVIGSLFILVNVAGIADSPRPPLSDVVGGLVVRCT